jgi:hypothetical protein
MFVECADFGDSDLSSPVLPHLTTLFFAPVDSSSSQFLARLNLPSVRLLHLEIYDSAHIDYLVQHCGPLLERVETVFLKVYMRNFNQLAFLLASMPALVRLDGRVDVPNIAAALHMVLLYWDNLCPLLRLLMLDDHLSYAAIISLLVIRPFTVEGKKFHLVLPGGNVADGVSNKLRDYYASDSVIVSRVARCHDFFSSQ